jgi:hypothetical protein
MSEEIVSALQRELSAPSRGEVILRILEKLSFFEIGGSLIAAAAQKVELTRSDGEIHSFSALLPSSSLTYLFMCIVYPGTLRDGGNAAREDLFRNPFGNRTEISGVLQLTIFAGDNPLSLAFAWLPSASVSDPDLGSVVIPWKLQAPEVERAEAQPGGAEIVALAEATRRLTEAMHELLLIWPDEEGPVQKLGLPEAREELVTSIQTFNSAAKRCGLAHRMPLSVYDETWLPHNIENALQFGSVAATVRAELARTRGSAAAGLFTRTLATPLDEGRSAELARLAEEYDVTAPSTPEIEPANPASGVDVFICYSWADKTRGARDVYEFVQRHGLSAWFDEERRLQTASLDGDIAAAISSAQTVIVCFSQEMITGGGYVLRELLFALSAAPQRLIVARLDKSAVPATLAGVATVDWFRRGGGDELLEVVKYEQQPLILHRIAQGGEQGLPANLADAERGCHRR